MSKKQDKVTRSTSTYWQYLKAECKKGGISKRSAERSFRKFVANRGNGLLRGNIIQNND
jgi:hypothetical protein